MHIVKDITSPGWEGVVVEIGQSRMTAVFVYQVEGGVIFVEPSYLDPWSSRPADHFIEGEISANSSRPESYQVGDALFYDPAIDDSPAPPGHDAAIYAWLNAIDGPTLKERERVQAQIVLPDAV